MLRSVFVGFFYLPPIFKEVLSEYLLGGVVMVQHLSKEQRYLFSCQAQLHLLACTDTKHKYTTAL